MNDIQRLREQTGAGVMECHKALKDAVGNFDKALLLINERGLIKAQKKSERTTKAGILVSYIHNERVGVLLEVRAETDFVARSVDFKQLAHELVMQIAAMNPADPSALLAQPYIKDESVSIGDFIKKSIAKFGENIEVAKFCRFEL
ncbi:MAG: translation elongation factor Ts [Candidatus Brennerbacteria bacterium]|nr:translation elongation factor Ts [Candidatus Brennerbacteria bacterium]